MAVATVDDVATSLGRPTSDLSAAETAQVAQWLADAELQIRLRLGDVALLDQEVLAFVEREAVVARMRNPDGVQSETVDDYTYRMPSESRRVTILDEWWRMLDPNTSSDAYSVRPGFEPDDVDPWTGWA